LDRGSLETETAAFLTGEKVGDLDGARVEALPLWDFFFLMVFSFDAAAAPASLEEVAFFSSETTTERDFFGPGLRTDVDGVAAFFVDETGGTKPGANADETGMGMVTELRRRRWEQRRSATMEHSSKL
jgi:hypothetical protein